MILAAGRGERMGALTTNEPKPLLKVRGTALIEHTINRLRSAGIKECVINLAYRGEQIRAALGDGKSLGVSIAYSQEPPGALDTGGGIFAALPLLGESPFIVVNSDVWSNYDFSQLHEPDGLAHLVLVPNPTHNRAGDFCLDEKKIVENNGKMYTYSGIGVYRREMFASQIDRRFPLAPLIRDAITHGQVSGELYPGVWLDVGTPERLLLVENYDALHK